MAIKSISKQSENLCFIVRKTATYFQLVIPTLLPFFLYKLILCTDMKERSADQVAREGSTGVLKLKLSNTVESFSVINSYFNVSETK